MKFFSEASPLRRALLALGGLAFVGGVALVAVAVLQVTGGDGKEEVEVRDLGTPTTAPRTPKPTANLTQTPIPTPPLPLEDYTMVIDKISVQAPVRKYGLDADAVPEVPTGDDAAQVVAWYNFSAQPGTGSNAVFAGHVTWFGAAVFYRLESLSVGDEIKLLGTDGVELKYKVTDVFQVVASDPNSLQVMSASDTDIITIITCDGTYTDTNDPIFGGEYDNRLVVRAALESPAAVSAGG
ncbi:MAG: class F sortase [Dehalococcoidia bacterium]